MADEQSTKLWLDDPCRCIICSRLRRTQVRTRNAWSDLDDLKLIGGERGKQIIQDISLVEDDVQMVLMQLHREHKPELYADEDESDVVTDGESDYSSEEPESPGETGDGGEDVEDTQTRDCRFTVCDHCRGHGLRCNEAPVCIQCQLSATPCIHRWCETGRDSIDDCTDPSCRYAHNDHLPVPEPRYSAGDYIILPGTLRGYLHDGKLPSFAWDDMGLDGLDIRAFDQKAKKRQKLARQDIAGWVSDGHGALSKWYSGCGTVCSSFMLAEDESE